MHITLKIPKTFLHKIPIAILVISHQGDIVFSNTASCVEFPTLSRKQQTLESFSAVYSPKELENSKTILGIFESAEQKQAIHTTLVFLKDTKRYTYIVNVSPLYENSGMLFYYCSLENVSPELIQQDRQTIFMKTFGHEIRQPLTLVKLYSGRIATYLDKQHAKEHKYAVKIHNNVVRMVKMVNDLTAAQQFSLQNFTLGKKKFEIRGFFIHLMEDIRIVYPERVFITKVNIKEEICEVETDSYRLKQIITNLIDNACKYSVIPNPIEVSFTVTTKHIIVKVKDHGIGISPKQQKSIFKPYYRASRKNLTQKGLGLGLYFVSHIVKRSEGTISVASGKGEGSTFTVKLPRFSRL